MLVGSLGDPVSVDHKNLALFHSDEMLVIMRIVKHAERGVTVFDESEFAARFYKDRRIVAGIRKDKSTVGTIQDSVDRCNKDVVFDRIPEKVIHVRQSYVRRVSDLHSGPKTRPQERHQQRCGYSLSDCVRNNDADLIVKDLHPIVIVARDLLRRKNICADVEVFENGIVVGQQFELNRARDLKLRLDAFFFDRLLMQLYLFNDDRHLRCEELQHCKVVFVVCVQMIAFKIEHAKNLIV